MPSFELVLHSRNPQACLDFYREFLGMPARGSVLGEEGAEIRVVGGEPPRNREHYLVVSVPDVKALVGRLREAGHEVLREWREQGEARALVSDPDGNLLELAPEER